MMPPRRLLLPPPPPPPSHNTPSLNWWSSVLPEQSFLVKLYNATVIFLRSGNPSMSQQQPQQNDDHSNHNHHHHHRHHRRRKQQFRILPTRALTIPRMLFVGLMLIIISLLQHYSTYTTILVSSSSRSVSENDSEMLTFQSPGAYSGRPATTTTTARAMSVSESANKPPYIRTKKKMASTSSVLYSSNESETNSSMSDPPILSSSSSSSINSTTHHDHHHHYNNNNNKRRNSSSNSSSSSSSSSSSLPLSICTSPEKDVPWPLHGTIQSKINPSYTCGISPPPPAATGSSSSSSSSSTFAEYFRTVLIPQQVSPIVEEEQCHNLVVFGVAFGESFLNLIIEKEFATRTRIAQQQQQQPQSDTAKKKRKRRKGPLYNPQDLIQRHNKCFFIFVLEEESDKLLPPFESTIGQFLWSWSWSWLWPFRSSSSSSSTTTTTTTAATTITRSNKVKRIGHNWLIPIPTSVLPYENMRRNAKLLKYMGHLAFTTTEGSDKNKTSKITTTTTATTTTSTTAVKTIIWQDAKFLRFDERVIPLRYDTLFQSKKKYYHQGKASIILPKSHDNNNQNSTTTTTTPRRRDGDQQRTMSWEQPQQPCITSMGLPIHESAFYHLTNQTSYGRTYGYRPKFVDHCRAIIDALTERPGVTDSPQSLLDQCKIYIQHVMVAEEKEKENDTSARSGSTNRLDLALIDSAFIVWNESTEMCREFNAALRCTILDQLHCHSDRDQVNIPFALYHMGLEAQYRNDKDIVALTDMDLHEGPRNATQEAPHPRPVDDEWQTRVHDLTWVYKRGVGGNDTVGQSGSDDVLLRIIPSSCHWYYTFPIGRRDDCNTMSWLPSIDEWRDELALYRAEQGLEKLSRAKRSLFMSASSTIQLASLGRNDHRECTSPEHHVQWPPTPRKGKHQGSTQPTKPVPGGADDRDDNDADVDPHSPCGIEEWPLFYYLKSFVWTKKLKHTALKRCRDRITFDATFELGGSRNRTSLDVRTTSTSLFWNTSDLHKMRGKCRFTFVYEEDLYASISKVKKGRHIFYGDNLLLPISRSIMPYESHQRNANLLKYMVGPSLLGNISNIVWDQGTSIVAWNRDDGDRSNNDDQNDPLRIPQRYRETYAGSTSDIPCLTAVGVPVGSKRGSIYQSECKKLILMHLLDQSGPSKTVRKLKQATTLSLTQQCDAYMQLVYGREMGTHFLDQGVVDTNVLLWNESTEICRDFNAVLRCIMLNQGHCHSGHDEVVFPFALYQIGLSSYYFPEPTERNGTEGSSNVKVLVHDFDGYAHHLIDFQDTEGGVPMVRVIRSNTTTSSLALP
jgi:hypothetical protein